MRMNLDRVVSALNTLLRRMQPILINSSWVQRHAPACYRYIQRRIRGVTGGIDWDRVTRALDPMYQRRWKPARVLKHPVYRSAKELKMALQCYVSKLYVFLSPGDV